LKQLKMGSLQPSVSGVAAVASVVTAGSHGRD
jgi:hypothetical protein